MKIEIIQQCELVINELQRFGNNILNLGKPIPDNRLEDFEQNIRFGLPLDFKYLLKRFNGFSLAGTEVYGISKRLSGSSLDKVYYFENEKTENPIFKEFLPFSSDGRGNHYCLDLSRLANELCPVVFWQHNYFYKGKSEVETCNNNFHDWVKEVMIEWTLDIFDYEGNNK